MKAPAQAKQSPEVIALLRQAWRHAEAANYALSQIRKHKSTQDLMEAFLMQAADHTQKSKEAIERAASVLTFLKAEMDRVKGQL